MLPRITALLASAMLLLPVATPLRADIILTQGQDFGVDVSTIDGSIAIDLMGSIWTIPANGGQARQLTDGLALAKAPRWSPDGASILYQISSAAGAEIWRLHLSSAQAERVSEPGFHNQDAAWHPQGERVVFASERNDSGLDIWETDLPTGLSWRLTSHAGDETEPTWSRNGRHLAYIHKDAERFALVLRRLGEAEQVLVSSTSRLSSPSWRPDGSLITFLRHGEEGPSLEMVILSDPPLTRPFATGEDFFVAPVSWRDRSQLFYTADGAIKTRGFEDRRSRRLRFNAVVRNEEAPARRTIPDRALPVNNPPESRLVIRGARLFDGIWSTYREQMDVLIEDGVIVSIEPRRGWDDVTILDLGDVTVMPGFIDSWSGAPGSLETGAAILAYGVTTIVSDSLNDGVDRSAWDDEDMPGPRILRAATVSASSVAGNSGIFLVNLLPATTGIEENRSAVQKWRESGVPVVASNWSMGTRLGADILLGAASAYSGYPAGQGRAATAPPIIISGLADGGTPGIATLLASRQALELGQTRQPTRRLSDIPRLAASTSLIVAGSMPNGLPPGQALHAELRALRAAGLGGEQTLHTVGRNAARMLGLDNQIGIITPGAMADLVLVAGDPLQSVDDALKIVAVVRNGRFFSLVSLLERVNAAAAVE